ncbi:MAG: hypothetical protein AAGC68_14540 [Verrucomicrobiota bacterium]
MSSPLPKLLYCRCAFAQVVPKATKDAVLEELCVSDHSFETVSDLCEMSARKDPRLEDLINDDAPLRIVACHPRAVKWLFHSAGFPFPEDKEIEVINMRDDSAETIIAKLEEAPAQS